MKFKLTIYAVILLVSLGFVRSAHGAITLRPPLNLGLVGYWGMDEGAGSIAGDSSGNGNTGNLGTGSSAPTWADGKRGKALSFDGTNDYVDTSDSGGIYFGSTDLVATVVFWAKGSGRAISTERTISNRAGDGRISIEADGNMAYYTNYNSGPPYSTTVPTNFPSIEPSSNWHMYALAINGPSDLYDFYVDSNHQQKSLSFTMTGLITEYKNIEIGRHRNYTYDEAYFNGLIDEVRIYNRALSETEVAALYNSGAAKFLLPDNTGLVAHWGMDEGTGTKAGDMSGNGLTTNTFTGSPTWAAGKKGKALQFSGAGTDYATVSDNSALNFGASQDFTVAAWVKSTASQISGRYPGIVAKEDGIATRNGYGLILYGSVTTPLWYFTIFSGGGQYAAYGSSSIRDGDWHFIAGVRSGSQLLTYQDGILAGTGPGSSGSVSKATSLYIGRHQGSPHYAAATYDEVRIYNRALSATEISGLYQSSGKGAEINLSQNNRLTSGLVGLWSFNGQDIYGNTAYDRSGSNNHGTLGVGSSAPTPVEGKVGQALNFDGSNDYLSVNDSSSLNTSTNVTISAFAKVSVGSGSDYLFSKFSNGAIRLYGYIRPDGQVRVVVRDDTPDGDERVQSTTLLTTNVWYHIVFTADGTNMRLYINGALEDTQALNYSFSEQAGNNLLIGAYPPWSAFLRGAIDEVRVYNRVLSVGEVQQLYNMGR